MDTIIIHKHTFTFKADLWMYTFIFTEHQQIMKKNRLRNIYLFIFNSKPFDKKTEKAIEIR